MIVVDASALTDALVDDGPAGEGARAELAEDPHWAAPAHLVVEVISAVRGKLLGGKVALARSEEAIAALADIEVDVVEPFQNVDRVWQLRDNVTPYDAAYLTAAEQLDCALVTGDSRLTRVPGVRCEVRLVHRRLPGDAARHR